MMDWDALVLNPLENLMSISVRITPVVTRPGTGPFDARGIFSSEALSVEMQDGTVFSDQQTRLGIRLADFTHVPARGDIVKILEGPHTGEIFWIGDSNGDGQGGSSLALHTKEPS